MKFGKQFEFYKIPEWSEYYLDYDGIKTVIKFLDKRRLKKKQLKKIKKLKANLRKLSTKSLDYNSLEDSNDINTNAIQLENKSDDNLLAPETQKLQRANSLSLKTEKIMEAEDLSSYSNEEKLSRFIQIYKSKIGSVNEFFMKKLGEFIQNFEKLKAKIDTKNKVLSKDSANARRASLNLNAERDEMGYAVSWKRALSSLYNETSWLHSYHSINMLAIQKIQKKIKKIFKLNKIFGIENALKNADNEYPFFNESINRLVELRKNIKKLYAGEFTNLDVNKASKELDSRLQGAGKIKHTRLIYFYFGIIFACSIFLICLSRIKTEKNKSLATFFPAFNFGLVIIESMIGVGCVVSILKKYRINYVYILEIDLKARLGPSELFQNGFMMLAIWMLILLLMKMTIIFDFFGGKYALFALILNGLLVIFLFLPFHIMYHSFRKGTVKVLIRNLFPIGRNTVRFKDFLFGDILTSLNKPFASLILGYCLMSCLDCEVNNERNKSICNRETIPCLIVLFYPFFIRFTQCINRYYYTRQKWPHLGNTFKYVGGLSNAICAWLYSRYKTDEYLYLHIAVGIISQSYMLFWDIYVDWGLGRCSQKNTFLRDKIVYPKKWYYFAIVIDMILRFSWTWNFIKIDEEYDEWKNLVLAMLEAYRRIQWCVFRIENENCSNPENYRTILAIPELPLD
jgi:hypothetical protein